MVAEIKTEKSGRGTRLVNIVVKVRRDGKMVNRSGIKVKYSCLTIHMMPSVSSYQVV